MPAQIEIATRDRRARSAPAQMRHGAPCQWPQHASCTRWGPTRPARPRRYPSASALRRPYAYGCTHSSPPWARRAGNATSVGHLEAKLLGAAGVTRVRLIMSGEGSYAAAYTPEAAGMHWLHILVSDSEHAAAQASPWRCASPTPFVCMFACYWVGCLYVSVFVCFLVCLFSCSFTLWKLGAWPLSTCRVPLVFPRTPIEFALEHNRARGAVLRGTRGTHGPRMR
jgi:hypothetical protein